MKYEDFKGLFEQKFYSMEDNRIVEWQVEKVILCNYNRDKYGNLCPVYDGNLDMEYGLKRKEKDTYKHVTIHKNMIGRTFFESTRDLVNSIMPK